MAYSELIKNFERIRDYMRQFYVFGFKSRSEFDAKSARSYDNERRRVESWLGDFMHFRRAADGKNAFLSVDTRSIPANPLYNAFKAKSFTSGDVTFHFYVLDLLRDGAYTAGEITALLSERCLADFPAERIPDLSTVRKKLKEYTALGLLTSEKRGRELIYSRNESTVDLAAWADAAVFFSEADPLGVIGSTLLDKLPETKQLFRFKHHYMLHALDGQILLQLLTAIGERRNVTLENAARRGKTAHAVHTVCPLRIFISTQGGRQYLLCYHLELQKLMFFRLDYIRSVSPGETEPEFDRYLGYGEKYRTHLWGTSGGRDFNIDYLEMTVRFEDNEQYIPQRLIREKRNGCVEMLDANTCRYTVATYDASELLPWLRTFIGRIEKLECTDEAVVRLFYRDLDAMCALYGGEK